MTQLSDYEYDLSPELIAQQPLAQRSDARLLVVDRQHATLRHSYVRDLAEWFVAGDCLVLNDTQVVPARLLGRRRRTGGRWFGLFLEATAEGLWRIMCRTRGKLQEHEVIILEDRLGRDDVQLHLTMRLDDGTWIVRPDSGESPLALLERVGRVPLPHYIRRGEMIEADMQTYQTVFASNPGAVAAPTAGLHFTQSLLDDLQQRGVQLVKLTLHVGMGTFRPIHADSLDEHHMHEEWGRIGHREVDLLNARRAAGGRIIAVGTTVVRVLETAAAAGELQPWEGRTQLFIRPGHRFRACDALMTNFHLPRTTLLVLVRTFGGDSLIRQAYAEAIRERYRFYSYGDSMLIL